MSYFFFDKSSGFEENKYYSFFFYVQGAIPRCKPFKYTYEKEIVMYAYFKKLDYFR